MVNLKPVQSRIICNKCKKEFEYGDNYYMIQTMTKGKLTNYKERKLQHLCKECFNQ